MKEAPVILVIEDSPSTLHSIVGILNQAGYRTREATTALEAIQVARDECPNLILADMGLPDADGSTALAALREDPAFWKIPVILVSGLEREELSLKMAHSGAVDLLPKPFLPADLVRCVRHWLAGN